VAEGAAVAVVEVVQVQGKILALLLVGVAIAVAIFLWLGVSAGQLEPTGFAAGFILFVLPFLAAAAYLLYQSFTESGQLNSLAKEQRVLDALRSRGKTTFTELSKETGLGEDEVKRSVEGLVGKNLFTGYISWKAGELYSKETGDLASGKACPNCGAKLEIAGKGMVKCAYCGTEIFG